MEKSRRYFVVFSLIGLLFLFACDEVKDFEYPDDNIAEEIIEEIIQQKTGFDLDLTPNSPEGDIYVSDEEE